MKKLLMIMVCLLTMIAASLSAKAQEITINLLPGWTWISYPRAEVLDIYTALGDFVPMEGDIIKSQFSNSTYSRGMWIGGVTHFMPGWGYKYYSNRTEVVSFVFAGPTPQAQVQVSTSEPMLITAISAMGGGEVTTTDGTNIIVNGLCWSTHENPTINDDFYEEAESGVGSFSISMTELNIATTYYVRAYAVTPNGTVYGDQKSFTTRDGIPTVNTAEVTNILGDGATCGGTVIDNGGLNVIARGICWSADHNPTINDSHTTDGSGLGSFTTNILGLSLNSTYYVRAYAFTSQGISYGDEISFTTQSSSIGLYVDLGLPSGTLWAMCNVGAEYPEAYGDYYAWGETHAKRSYYWNTYQYCNGSGNTLTKYCNDPEYGNDGFTDDLTLLLSEDDAASANWGVNWRMPTIEEWEELYNSTTYSWTTQNGIQGGLFVASNGNSLFLPAGGFYHEYLLYNQNEGQYWSSSLSTWFGPDYANYFNFQSSGGMNPSSIRCGGRFVRAVHAGAQSASFVINATANPENGGSVNGGGTYNEDAECTLVATATAGYVFVNWTKDGEVVSTNASYTFIVSENATYVANFSVNSYQITAIANPTNAGMVTGGGSYGSGQDCTVQTTANLGYTFMNWTENGSEVSTNSTYTFTVNADRTLVANFIYNGGGDQPYVDLGLPSGTLWATYNVGADSPEEYGDYFAWGETQPKDTYNWSNYQYCNGSYNTITKYCYNPLFGFNGFTDNLTTLLPDDDAATSNLGSDWRMPTEVEWEELANYTTYSWTNRNGIEGILYTASNGNSIFLPAAGYRDGNNLYDAGSYSCYWSSSLCLCQEGPEVAMDSDRGIQDRHTGYPIRPVRCKNSVISLIVNPNGGGSVNGSGTYLDQTNCTLTAVANPGYFFMGWTENSKMVSTDASYSFAVNGNRNIEANFIIIGEHPFVDLGLPSGLLWATYNVGANALEEYGDYYAWGEFLPKNLYCWSTYRHGNMDYIGENEVYGYFTKYNTLSTFGPVDNLISLLPNDDAATANWGANWRIPTKEEWLELYNNTTFTWITQNGVQGGLFTASNGNSLFLPAAGYRRDDEFNGASDFGAYWSSSLDTSTPYRAWGFYFNSGGTYVSFYRSNGLLVRPVTLRQPQE